MAFGDDLQEPLRGSPEADTCLPPEVVRDAERTYWRARAMADTLNYWIISFWLLIAFSGFCIACGGLSSLEYHTNKEGYIVLFYTDAALPHLVPASLFRFDYFANFLQFWACLTILLVMTCDIKETMRTALVGYLASFATMQCIAADRFLNVADFTEGPVQQAAITAFSGFVISAVADYFLVYHFGSNWSVLEAP